MVCFNKYLSKLSVDYSKVKESFQNLEIEQHTKFEYSNLEFYVEIYQYSMEQFEAGNNKMYHREKKDNFFHIGLPKSLDTKFRKPFVVKEAVAARLYQDIREDEDTIFQIIKKKSSTYNLASKTAEIYAGEILSEKDHNKFKTFMKYYSYS